MYQRAAFLSLSLHGRLETSRWIHGWREWQGGSFDQVWRRDQRWICRYVTSSSRKMIGKFSLEHTSNHKSFTCERKDAEHVNTCVFYAAMIDCTEASSVDVEPLWRFSARLGGWHGPLCCARCCCTDAVIIWRLHRPFELRTNCLAVTCQLLAACFAVLCWKCRSVLSQSHEGFFFVSLA
jgi:hypothetical protein